MLSFLFMFVLLLGFSSSVSFQDFGSFNGFQFKGMFPSFPYHSLFFCKTSCTYYIFFIRFISCILLLTLKLTLFCCYGRGSWLLLAEGPFLFFWSLVRLETTRCNSFVFLRNTLVKPLINAFHVSECGHGSDKGESFGGRVKSLLNVRVL